jgi:hypothetical protein
MKKLAYPWLLVAASLMFSVMLTTITAVSFASYEKANKNSATQNEKLTKIVDDKTINSNLTSVK